MSSKSGLPDYPRSQGASALGARLRRLSERIDRETTLAYRNHGVVFEQRWFGPLDRLRAGGPQSVGDLAVQLGISHAAVSQSLSAMMSAGLIGLTTDTTDRRRRTAALTERGLTFCAEMEPLWLRLMEVARILDAEAGGLVQRIDRLEQALDRASIGERLAKLELPSPAGNTARGLSRKPAQS